MLISSRECLSLISTIKRTYIILGLTYISFVLVRYMRILVEYDLGLENFSYDYHRKIKSRGGLLFKPEDLLKICFLYDCISETALEKFFNLYSSILNDPYISRVRRRISDILRNKNMPYQPVYEFLSSPAIPIVYDHRVLLDIYYEEVAQKSHNLGLAGKIIKILDEYLFQPVMPLVETIRKTLYRMLRDSKLNIDKNKGDIILTLPNWMRWIPIDIHPTEPEEGEGIAIDIVDFYHNGRPFWPVINVIPEFGDRCELRISIDFPPIHIFMFPSEERRSNELILSLVGEFSRDTGIDVSLFYDDSYDNICFTIIEYEVLRFVDINKIEVAFDFSNKDTFLKICKDDLNKASKDLSYIEEPVFRSLKLLKDIFRQLSADELYRRIESGLEKMLSILGQSVGYGIGFISGMDILGIVYTLNEELAEDYIHLFKNSVLLAIDALMPILEL